MVDGKYICLYRFNERDLGGTAYIPEKFIQDMKKRVVITGVGVVSPIGIGVDAYFKALKNGKMKKVIWLILVCPHRINLKLI